MARPSDREYALKRRVKDLEEQNEKLEKEIKTLRKQAEKEILPNPKKVKVVLKPCPDCGAEIKVTELPHAKMSLCSAACGYRKVE